MRNIQENEDSFVLEFTADDEEPNCMTCENVQADYKWCDWCGKSGWSGYRRLETIFYKKND